MRLLALSIIFTACALGENFNTTDGVFNGRLWNQDVPEARTGYILGYMEGMADLVNLSDSPRAEKTFKALASPSFLVGEVFKEMNQLYENQANLNIPIREMIRYALLVLKGELTEAELDTRLHILRSAANKGDVK